MNDYKYTEAPGARDGTPNPAVQIYLWLCSLLLVQIAPVSTLLLIAGMLIVITMIFFTKRFVKLIRRTRWILISLLIIYAYTGAGEALWPSLGVLSPGFDGMMNGLLQLLRLLSVLAGLSILLTLLSTSQLIAGIYTLLLPLQYFGVSRETIAVRLALTLHYAEQSMLERHTKWQENFEKLLRPTEVKVDEIELNLVRMNYRDWLLVVTSTTALLGMVI